MKSTCTWSIPLSQTHSHLWVEADDGYDKHMSDPNDDTFLD